jgi:hypothetical protein
LSLKMFKALRNLVLAFVALFVLLLVGLNIWGLVTLGTVSLDVNALRDSQSNKVVLVTGATGSVGDGLLKAAMADEEVEKLYALTRRMSPRLEKGQSSGRVKVLIHQDFTDYSELTQELAEVNTVLWGLGTTSIGMESEWYRVIHEDFPVNFVRQWITARSGEGPMAFHYVTGMGTGEDEDDEWAQVKGRAERRVAELAEGTDLRTFGHRSAWVRPTDENANWLMCAMEPLLIPGHLVIRGVDLGGAMLEISARTHELPNGQLLDNKDAREYAEAYRTQ